MKELTKSDVWISGLQWLFFIFSNIVVIPITVGAAFHLPSERVVLLLQLSFIVTGIACLLQALFGHGRPIMEGQSGLWWGVILTLATTAAAQGMPLTELGGSLAVGILLSSLITILIGLAGLGPKLATLFKPTVMGVFMFLFGCQLILIFMKGMLGIPFESDTSQANIQVPIALLSIVIAIFVIFISVKAPTHIRKYSLLIGIFIGWGMYEVMIGTPTGLSTTSQLEFTLFPLGRPRWNTGIIVTVIVTGLLNMSNTFGALKGTDSMFQKQTNDKEYRNSFVLTGLINTCAACIGIVPYAPYVSSIGFLKQTNDVRRLPFIIGGVMFFIMGCIPTIGYFFSLMPLSVGSAVLFVAYLQLFNAASDFFKQVEFNTVNVYRTAIPLFVGIVIMTMPPVYFESLPKLMQPLISNGLLVGIILALLLENLISWDAYQPSKGHASNKVQYHHVFLSHESHETLVGVKGKEEMNNALNDKNSY